MLIVLLLAVGVHTVVEQPEPYHQVRHYGVNHNDRSDTLDFVFYDNTISGVLILNNEIINFTYPVIFTNDKFLTLADCRKAWLFLLFWALSGYLALYRYKRLSGYL